MDTSLKAFYWLLLITVLGLILTGAAHASTVTLTWTDSDSSVTGYKVYGTSVANCSTLVPATPVVSPWVLIGTTTSPTDAVNVGSSGVDCYYVTATNAAGQESNPSNVAKATIPLQPPVLATPVVQ